MKNIYKLFKTFVLVVVIGFFLAACSAKGHATAKLDGTFGSESSGSLIFSENKVLYITPDGTSQQEYAYEIKEKDGNLYVDMKYGNYIMEHKYDPDENTLKRGASVYIKK